MDLELTGKTALVTRASEGIGMAITRGLAEEGVRVAICARTEARLCETAAAIAKATAVEVVAIPADLRSLPGCEGFVEAAAARLGGVTAWRPAASRLPAPTVSCRPAPPRRAPRPRPCSTSS
jgi:short-subunit dehydrogenase